MLKCQKDLFSLEPHITYLNCAYKGPLLKKSEEKIFEAIENERNPFKLKAPNYFQISNEIRKEYSTIINSHQQEIAILPSTSYGFANVFNNIIRKYRLCRLLFTRSIYRSFISSKFYRWNI